MSLNESIVEDAALEWFLLRSAPLNSGGQVGALGDAVGHLPALRSATRQAGGPQLAPGEPAAESARALHADRRDSFGEVVLVGRLREAIRRLNPVLPPSRTLATLRATLLPKRRSGELGVASACANVGAAA
jgi:type I restriction enzyme R subunit